MVRERTLEDVVRLITPVLNDWELFYVVVADLAKKIYGQEREVNEIELLVNLREKEAEKLKRYLTSELFTLRSQDEMSILLEDSRGETIIRLTTVNDQFEMMTIGRRMVQDFFHSMVFVASVEDLVLREIKKGKKKNLNEAIGLYSYWRNHLDISYLVKMARQLGIYNKFIKMKKKGDAKH